SCRACRSPCRPSRRGTAYVFFFFQAEAGIRDFHVTGVQTCALPIYAGPGFRMHTTPTEGHPRHVGRAVVDMMFDRNAPSRVPIKIGRASCRERAQTAAADVAVHTTADPGNAAAAEPVMCTRAQGGAG